MSEPEDPIEALSKTFSNEEAAEVVRRSMQLSEAYYRWAFEPRNSLKIQILGDLIQSCFRRYLEKAHPDAFDRLKLAEKGFRLPRVVID